MMDSIPRVNPKVFEAGQTNVRRLKSYIYTKMQTLMIERGWLLCIVGFLLGRAVVLSVVSPFAVALLATLWLMKRDKAFKVMIDTSIGAFTFTLDQGIYVSIAMLIFILIAGLFKKTKNKQVAIPFFVLIASMAPRLFLYSLEGPLPSYEWMLLIVEGVLGYILLLIFIQIVSLLYPKRYNHLLSSIRFKY